MTSSYESSAKNDIANYFVAIIHLLEYNKYHISLLELLAKKACSISFVSQYIYV